MLSDKIGALLGSLRVEPGGSKLTGSTRGISQQFPEKTIHYGPYINGGFEVQGRGLDVGFEFRV